MFELSFSEIAFAAVVAFILFGPEQFPVMARKAAQYFKKAKAYIHQAQVSFQEMSKELVPDTDLSKPINLKDFMGTPMNRAATKNRDEGLKMVNLDKEPTHYPSTQPWRKAIQIDRHKANYSIETHSWREPLKTQDTINDITPENSK